MWPRQTPCLAPRISKACARGCAAREPLLSRDPTARLSPPKRTGGGGEDRQSEGSGQRQMMSPLRSPRQLGRGFAPRVVSARRTVVSTHSRSVYCTKSGVQQFEANLRSKATRRCLIQAGRRAPGGLSTRRGLLAPPPRQSCDSEGGFAIYRQWPVARLSLRDCRAARCTPLARSCPPRCRKNTSRDVRSSRHQQLLHTTSSSQGARRVRPHPPLPTPSVPCMMVEDAGSISPNDR